MENIATPPVCNSAVGKPSSPLRGPSTVNGGEALDHSLLFDPDMDGQLPPAPISLLVTSGDDSGRQDGAVRQETSVDLARSVSDTRQDDSLSRPPSLQHPPVTIIMENDAHSNSKPHRLTAPSGIQMFNGTSGPPSQQDHYRDLSASLGLLTLAQHESPHFSRAATGPSSLKATVIRPKRPATAPDANRPRKSLSVRLGLSPSFVLQERHKRLPTEKEQLARHAATFWSPLVAFIGNF